MNILHGTLKWLALGGALALSVPFPAGAQTKPITIGGTLGLTGLSAAPSAEYKAIYD